MRLPEQKKGEKMSGLTHVLWDWNGTLLDDVDVCIAVENQMRGVRGIHPPLTRAWYREIFGFPVKAFYERAGFRFNQESFEQVAAIYTDAYQRDSEVCALHPGAWEVLGAVQRMGLRQIILSATKQELLVEQMRRYPILHFFEQVLGIDDVYASSKVGLAQGWMRGESVHPGAVVLVGDTLHDYEVAKALGCRCVLIANGHQSHSRLAACGCALVGSVGEVPAWLRCNAGVER